MALQLQSRDGENALVEAVTYRRYDIACTLAARPGTEVDVLDARDRTPLIMAVQCGYAPLVRSRRRKSLDRGRERGWRV